MGTIIISILQKLKLEALGNLPVVIHLLKILFWIRKSTIWSLTQVAQSFRWERKTKNYGSVWRAQRWRPAQSAAETQGHLTQPRSGEGVRGVS